jgi:hypothetical protein
MSWLDNYSTTNTFRSMYINGFIDISGGRLQTRSVTDGHLLIAGDTSLNGNLYVGGDISWNPNNLADNSIPSSAIIGGVGGATGPAGDNGVNGNAEYWLLEATNHPNNDTYSLTQTDFKVSGTVDMLSDPRVHRADGVPWYGWKMIAMLFKPGVYQISLNGRLGPQINDLFIGFDVNNDGLLGINMPGTENYEGFNINTGNREASQAFTWVKQYTVHNDSVLYFMEQYSNAGSEQDFFNYPNQYLTILIDRIGYVEPSGTNGTLQVPSWATITDTRTVEGGWAWSNNTSNPPASGYEPSNHTSQGGTNEWAVVEQAAETVQNVLGWVHRININPTSSVEVASFHSDADLSLNKRLFVGEDVTLNKRLFVGEDVSLNGNLYVDGGLDMNNNNILNCTNINTSAINGLAPATVNTRFIIGNLAYSAYNSFLSLGDLFGETGQALQKNIPANIGDPNFVWTEERTFYWCNNPSYRVMQCAVSSNNTYYGVVLTPGVWKIKFNIGEVQTNSTTTFSMSFFIDNNNNGQLNDVAGGGSNQQQKARYVTVKGASDYHAVPQVDFTLTVGAPGIPSGGEVNSGYAKIMGIIGANGFFKPLTGFGSWSIECEQLQAFTWNGLYNGFTPPADRTPYGAGSNFSTAGSWTIAVCN